MPVHGGTVSFGAKHTLRDSRLQSSFSRMIKQMDYVLTSITMLLLPLMLQE